MSIELIGAGFGRTGTLSMQAALEMLYNVEDKHCYHFGCIVTRPHHISLWIEILSGRQDPSSVDWEAIFGPERFAATLDHPCTEYCLEIMQTYPNAKVILTYHPGGREKWYQSKLCHQLLIDSLTRWPLKPFFRLAATFFIKKLSRGSLGEGVEYKKLVYADLIQLAHLTEHNIWGNKGVRDSENALGHYDYWYAKIRKSVPKEKLLEYDVSMGWEPLCKFLGKPVPDVPFPKETHHSGKEIKKFVGTAEKCAWGFLGILGAGSVGCIWLCLRLII